MWNNKLLESPPVNSFLCKSQTVDINCLRNSLSTLKTTIKDNDILHIDAALLSRLIYRLKIKFRNDKGMKAMEKTNKSLSIYLTFNSKLRSDITQFLKSIPNSYSEDMYLPTKQMFEYILVKIQGFSKLMCRIVDSAAETTKYMSHRLKLGHFWNIAIAVLSAMSRIWQICKYLVNECCICYNKILPIKDELKIVGLNWLRPDHIFPDDLAEWLDLDWTKENLKTITQKQIDAPICILSDEDESDSEDIKFCYQYKNDYIVIDDIIKLTDDDVQFVNEYIDIIEKKDFKMKKTSNELPEPRDENEIDIEINIDNNTRDVMDDNISCIDAISVDDSTIEIDSTVDSDISLIQLPNKSLSGENSDVEIISDIRPIVPEVDVGEKVSRKRKRKKKKAKAAQSITESVPLLNDTVVDLCNTDTSPEKKILSNTQPPLKALQTPDVRRPGPASTKFPLCTSFADVDQTIKTENTENYSHVLNSINSIKKLNIFLEKERTYRSKKSPLSLTTNLNASQWNKLMIEVTTVLKTRKLFQRNKNAAVQEAIKMFLRHL